MGDTRTTILEAARDIALEEGYEAMTARAIAERTDLTDAGVHYHFETKSDLVVGLVEHLEERSRERLEGYEGPPEERLAAMFRDWYEATEALRDLTAPPSFQMISTAASGDEAVREALVSLIDYHVGVVAGVIREGVETGVFETDDPEGVATFLVSTLDGAAVRTALDLPGEPIARGTARHVLGDLYVDEPPSLSVGASREVDE